MTSSGVRWWLWPALAGVLAFRLLFGLSSDFFFEDQINPWTFVTTLARFLSFASLETNRFVDIDGAKRLAFFERHLWLAPLAAVMLVAGTLQPLWMLVDLIRRRDGHPSWRAMRWLVVGSVALVYASYAFVIESQQAHSFYVLSPVAFVAAGYCWTFVDSPRARRVAAWLLPVDDGQGAIDTFPSPRSR